MRQRLLVILLLGAVLTVLAYLYGPAASQRRGMKAAATHRDRLAPSLSADPRFSNLRFDVTTHPGLLIRGAVPDQQALDELQRIVRVPDGLGFRVIVRATVNSPATMQSVSDALSTD